MFLDLVLMELSNSDSQKQSRCGMHGIGGLFLNFSEFPEGVLCRVAVEQFSHAQVWRID